MDCPGACGAVPCPSCAEPRCPWGMEKSRVWLVLARRYLVGSSRFVAGGGTRWVLCARSPGSAHVAGAEQGKEGQGGAPSCVGSCAQHRAHPCVWGHGAAGGAAETPWVQQRPPGSFPMGELCPGAGSQPMSALCPFTTELCVCSVGPCAEPPVAQHHEVAEGPGGTWGPPWGALARHRRISAGAQAGCWLQEGTKPAPRVRPGGFGTRAVSLGVQPPHAAVSVPLQ